MPRLSGGREQPTGGGWPNRLWQLERLGRDLIPLIAIALATWAVIGVSGKADRVETRINQQAVGRRVAINVLCGFANGVAAAGKDTIASGEVGPPRFRRNLQRLGLPSESVRRAAAKAQADAYARKLTESVVQQSRTIGVISRKLVRKDGTLNCLVLQSAARSTARTAG